MRRILASTAVVAALVFAAPAAVTAQPVDQVCPDFDTGHLSAGNATELLITAPEGKVIVEVCVKAGSDNQGLGPEITTYDPGVTETVISHSSGKEISHYSVRYGDPPPTTTTTTTTTTTVEPLVVAPDFTG